MQIDQVNLQLDTSIFPSNIYQSGLLVDTPQDQAKNSDDKRTILERIPIQEEKPPRPVTKAEHELFTNFAPFEQELQPLSLKMVRRLGHATRQLLFLKDPVLVEESKEILETVRRYYPKNFFNATKSAIKATSSATIAQDFLNEGADTPTLATYT